MPEQNEEPTERSGTFRDSIASKAKRKLRARQNRQAPLWRGLGMMGMVGWSVAIPTLLGVLLGVWLDNVWEASPVPWTPILLVVGLIIGVAIAWSWIDQERKDIGGKRERKNG